MLGQSTRLSELARRLADLGVSFEQLGFGVEVEYLQDLEAFDLPDVELLELIEFAILELEIAAATEPFVPPLHNSTLAEGKITLGELEGGQRVCVDVQRQGTCSITHGVIAGQPGVGKSCLQAGIASSAAQAGISTLVIDSTKSFRHIEPVQDTHTFLRFADLRLNLWDSIDGVNHNELDQTVHKEIASSYHLIFGELEINTQLPTIRERETPYLPLIIERLAALRYRPGSRRANYRDSVELVLRNLLHATGKVMRCMQGMSIAELASGNHVLELSVLPSHQAFVVRSIFARLWLLAMSGQRLARPLIVVLDEGQVLATIEDFSSKLLLLRHAGITLLANFQNLSVAPVELLGNCDLLCMFRSVDQRDRDAFGKAANLSAEQIVHLARLGDGEFCCVLPGSQWKTPFLAKATRLEFASVTEKDIERQSKQATEGFDWKPIEQATVDLGETNRTGDGDGFDLQTRAFMLDVLSKEHAFSSLTQRCERAGVRSADKQGRVIRIPTNSRASLSASTARCRST